jgi:hypothetical protein
MISLFDFNYFNDLICHYLLIWVEMFDLGFFTGTFRRGCRGGFTLSPRILACQSRYALYKIREFVKC